MLIFKRQEVPQISLVCIQRKWCFSLGSFHLAFPSLVGFLFTSWMQFVFSFLSHPPNYWSDTEANRYLSSKNIHTMTSKLLAGRKQLSYQRYCYFSWGSFWLQWPWAPNPQNTVAWLVYTGQSRNERLRKVSHSF